MLLERVESMIKGIGIDATELERVAKIIERRPHFVERILTPAEQTLFASHSPHRQVEFLAGRYACKEAFLKLGDRHWESQFSRFRNITR